MRLRFLLVLAILASAASAEPFRARVTKVYDGDTIVVRDFLGTTETVRLEGIDAPERYQPFATKSRESLRRMVLHQIVTVVPREVDPYDRIVGVVLKGNADVGLEQVSQGLAWHYRYFADRQEYRNRVAYRDAESRARRERLGLWSRRDPVPPWRYRGHR